MSFSYVFAMFLRCALVVAFSAVCVVNARKLGWGGALLMVGAALLDAITVFGYFVLMFVREARLFEVMDALTILLNLGSAVMFLVAFVLWRKPLQSSSSSVSVPASNFGP